MNFGELLQQLRALDPRDPGRWPLAARVGAAALCFLLISVVCCYTLVWTSQQPVLEQYSNEESALRQEMTNKHSKATNLGLYREQLADIEKSFGALLRQLPSKTEVDNLLVDISQTGLASGLEEKLIQPLPEVKQDFYAERPIRIRLNGSYHQLGAFVSGIAALGRIVTIHNVEIVQQPGSTSYDNLQMEMTARTYRYLDDEEVAAVENEKRKNAAANKAAGAPEKNPS
jgi:type IV pilus assembly protein PilO